VYLHRLSFFSNIKEVDFGKYTCVVRNDVGATNTTILLKRAEVPPPIKELTIALIVIAGSILLVRFHERHLKLQFSVQVGDDARNAVENFANFRRDFQ